MSLAALQRLFVQLFVDPESLRLFLVKNHEELGPSLPSLRQSAEHYAFQVLELLRARGYLDAAFFTTLCAAFPRQAREIQDAAAALDIIIRPSPPPPPSPSLRVLVLAANPRDLPALALQREAALIEAQVRRGNLPGARSEFQSAWAVTADRLQEQLLAYNPHIVHFSGHGNELGEPELLDSDGVNARPIPVRAFARILSAACKPRCVVLNACFSAILGQELALAGIEVVIGMRDAVPDEVALAFAESFYRALVFGRSVHDAVEGARGIIEARGLRGVDLIQINCRPGVDPASITLL